MNGWEKFHRYVGVQGVMAIVLTMTMIYMLVSQIPIPDVLIGLMGTTWGFYFAKNGMNVANGVRSFRRTP